MDERTEKLRRKLIFKEDQIQRLTEENQRYKEAFKYSLRFVKNSRIGLDEKLIIQNQLKWIVKGETE